MYAVKEIFYSLQGEGAKAGSAAIFCRFSGCNLWSGRERDRGTAGCNFCDTDFVGVDGAYGGKYPSASALAYQIMRLWPPLSVRNRLIVFSGGEPLLQLDEVLIRAVHALGFFCAVESNGTIDPPAGIDWLTISPKASASLKVRRCNELKLVFPQPGIDPEIYADFDADHFFLQPLDNDQRSENTRDAVTYCMNHPQWRLSLQTHKYLGIQ